MDSFDNSHLDGISLEQSGEALRIDYSEPDQGGTRLVHRFRIFRNRNAEIEYGYAHDTNLQKNTVSLQDVPTRIFNDALNWIAQQSASKNQVLNELLSQFHKLIKESTKV